MNMELIVKEELDVAKLFNRDSLSQILTSIEKQALSFVFDVSDAQGRKDIASLAYQVARTKTLIDSLINDELTDLKAKVKEGDGYRKTARDFLDDLKGKVRSPLDEYEEEVKRVQEEKARKAREKIEKRMSDFAAYGGIPSYLDVAEWNDETFAAKLAEAKEAFEDEMDRLKAEEEARKAEAERMEKIRKEQEAEAAKLRAEKEAMEAERRKMEEERQAIDAEKRAEKERKDREAFEAQAKKDALIEAEKAAKEKAEREAAEAERQRKAEEKRQAAEEAERARQEALKPDKAKLQSWADSLLDTTLPQLSDTKALVIANNALQAICDIANDIHAKLEAL